MKSIIHSWAQSVALILILVLQIAALFTTSTAPNETTIEFVEAVKYGELDTGDSLFKLGDGNLFSFHAAFPEQNGHRFLIKLDNHGTEDRTDDEIIELWSAPLVEYQIEWAE